MNIFVSKLTILLSAIVLLSLLAVVGEYSKVEVTTLFQKSSAQIQPNSTNMTSSMTEILPTINQSSASVTNQTMSNQTVTNQSRPGESALVNLNLTQSSFEPVTENLNAARQALQDNDTAEAFISLNSASNELFELTSDQPAQRQVALQQFKALQTDLDQAQDALWNNDDLKALNEINSAGEELLMMTQGLPAGEEQEVEENEDEGQ